MARKSLSSAGVGHNSGMIDGAALQNYVRRVISLTEERKALNDDIKEVYEEAKEAGFVTKHIRQLVREQMMDQDELADHLNYMESLRHALGQLSDTPLGNAAERQSGLRRPGVPAEQTDIIEAINAAVQ
jgi:uncharacterized protein (UPF0335 family)